MLRPQAAADLVLGAVQPDHHHVEAAIAGCSGLGCQSAFLTVRRTVLTTPPIIRPWPATFFRRRGVFASLTKQAATVLDTLSSVIHALRTFSLGFLAIDLIRVFSLLTASTTVLGLTAGSGVPGHCLWRRGRRWRWRWRGTLTFGFEKSHYKHIPAVVAIVRYGLWRSTKLRIFLEYPLPGSESIRSM